MYLLHNIGNPPNNRPEVRANYTPVDKIPETGLTFDGIYKNVWEHRDIIRGRNAILFVMGDYIGKDNSFDVGMPHEEYCSLKELTDLLEDGHTLGWHTWSHRDLTTLSLEEARKEMLSPFPCDDFAYPYGRFNTDLMKLAEELGYKRAWSVTQGNDNPYSLYRSYT